MEKPIDFAHNDSSYEHWMRLERQYAEQEYRWAYYAPKDHQQAERCHQLRGKCMELAIDSLNKGLLENVLQTHIV